MTVWHKVKEQCYYILTECNRLLLLNNYFETAELRLSSDLPIFSSFKDDHTIGIDHLEDRASHTGFLSYWIGGSLFIHDRAVHSFLWCRNSSRNFERKKATDQGLTILNFGAWINSFQMYLESITDSSNSKKQ